jgi:hypothetical protein
LRPAPHCPPAAARCAAALPSTAPSGAAGKLTLKARQDPRRQRTICALQEFNKSTGGATKTCQESLRVHTRTVSAALLLIGFAASGLAATLAGPQAPDAFDTCAEEKDAAVRLACFERAVTARQAASTPAPAVTAAPASVPRTTPPAAPVVPKAAPARAADSEIGLEHKQLRKLHPERAEPPQNAVLFEAQVVKVLSRRPLISAFELDNGQVWEQIETMDGLWVKPKETITIRQGLMGGFLFKSADGHSVRVRRTQ